MRGALALAVLAAALLVAFAAGAHGRGSSHSTWTLDASGARVRLRLQAVELAGLPPLDDASFARRLRLGGCTVIDGSLTRGSSDPAWVEVSWRVACTERPRVLVSELFADVAPGHLHFVRLRAADGRLLGEQVLAAGARSWQLPETAAEPTLGESVLLGARHILSGADHLVFLLVLLVGAVALRNLVFVVTGFTLGHSVTLALAALGHVEPDTGAVEALIGLSIALVALENGWSLSQRRSSYLPAAAVAAIAAVGAVVAARSGELPFALAGMALFSGCYFALLGRAERPERWRAAIAALFGLVHGFGFAGALLDAPRPVAHALTALFGFNLGVELGQLALVAVAWPLLALAARRAPELRQRVVVYGSALALAAGTFWFVERALG